MGMSKLEKQVITTIRSMDYVKKFEESNADPRTIRVLLKLIQASATYEENDERYHLVLIDILNEAIHYALEKGKLKEVDIPNLLDSSAEEPKKVTGLPTSREIEVLRYLNEVGITDYDFLIDGLSDEYLQMIAKGVYLILKYGEASPEVAEFFDSLTKYVEE